MNEPSKRIETNPKVLGGAPVIRGTRIRVKLIRERLHAGSSVAEVLESYPNLTAEDVEAANAYAPDEDAEASTALELLELAAREGEPLDPDHSRERRSMRTRSGEVDSPDRTAALLYLLARDQLSVGAIEEALDRVRTMFQRGDPGAMRYANGWLARWAIDAATRLREGREQ